MSVFIPQTSDSSRFSWLLLSAHVKMGTQNCTRWLPGSSCSSVTHWMCCPPKLFAGSSYWVLEGFTWKEVRVVAVQLFLAHLYSKPRTSCWRWDTSFVRLEPHLYRASISCSIWKHSVLLKTSFLQTGKFSWYFRRNTVF